MEAAHTAASKHAAAAAAAALVPDGSTVGLGTGTTVAQLLPALARRGLDLRCVATSPATEEAARAAGLMVEPFDRLERLDIAIDGADQIDPAFWVLKGRGGAHTREKVVAQAANRFVVIASAEKMVSALRPPVPLELLAYGLPATLRALGSTTLREAPRTPDGGVLADYQAPIEDPAKLAGQLEATPGVIDHGLFRPGLITDLLIADGQTVKHLSPNP